MKKKIGFFTLAITSLLALGGVALASANQAQDYQQVNAITPEAHIYIGQDFDVEWDGSPVHDKMNGGTFTLDYDSDNSKFVMGLDSISISDSFLDGPDCQRTVQIITNAKLDIVVSGLCAFLYKEVHELATGIVVFSIDTGSAANVTTIKGDGELRIMGKDDVLPDITNVGLECMYPLVYEGRKLLVNVGNHPNENTGGSSYGIKAHNSFTVNSGEIEVYSGVVNTSAGETVAYYQNGGSFNMNGGKMTLYGAGAYSTDSYGMKLDVATMNLNGGIISSQSGKVTGTGNTHGLGLCSGAIVNVNGGEHKFVGLGAPDNSYGIYAEAGSPAVVNVGLGITKLTVRGTHNNSLNGRSFNNIKVNNEGIGYTYVTPGGDVHEDVIEESEGTPQTIPNRLRFEFVGVQFTVNDCVVEYNGEDHEVTWELTYPDDARIDFGYAPGLYNESHIAYQDVGIYTVYYQVSSPSESYHREGEATITINKAPAPFIHHPVAKTGLYYDGSLQTLVDEGETLDDCIIMYRFKDEAFWSSAVPQATNVGTYVIEYYIVSTAANYKESEVYEVEAEILENDKTAITALYNEATAYKASIVEEYPDIANAMPFTAAIYSAGTCVSNKNVSVDTINGAISTLQTRLNQARAAVTDEIIAAIGEVSYTPASLAKITAARGAYDALVKEAQALVTKLETLTAAEKAYGDLDALHKAAEAVEAKITAIGTVEYTEASKAKIDLARASYDGATAVVKDLVTNYKVLTDAEAAYAVLVSDHVAADAVATKINNIGTVAYTVESKVLIVTARSAYNELTEAQKPLVSNYATLTAAEAKYDELELAATHHSIEDKTSGVVIETVNGSGIPLDTTVKASQSETVKAEKGSKAYENIQAALAKNQKIVRVYTVEMVKGGTESVQPGTKIRVSINVEEGFDPTNMKILHIHNENDISFLENFTFENGVLSFEVDKLSEFALVDTFATGLPGWAIALIVLFSVILAFAIALVVMFYFFPRYFVEGHEVIRAICFYKRGDNLYLFDLRCKFTVRKSSEVYKEKPSVQ